jgi:GNAT superfamily N-acetyltransferase
MSVIVRAATPTDSAEILRYIHALAEYEKAPSEVVLSISDLESSLFCENPKVYCLLSQLGDEITGIAIWHLNYSTWLGKHGMYLEDLFVDPKHRGAGHGKALLIRLAQICVEKGYPRFQWWVLDWNQPAIDFYNSLGAVAMDEWTVFRLTGEDLIKLANEGN